MAVDRADHHRKVLETAPGTEVTVDLQSKTMQCGSVIAPFAVDGCTRWRLLEGLDDIGLTLRHEADLTGAAPPSKRRGQPSSRRLCP